MVEGALEGLHGLIMAYGQTASGKSYTMGILQESTSPTAEDPCPVDCIQLDTACTHQPSASTIGVGLTPGTGGGKFWNTERSECDFDSSTSSTGPGTDSSYTTRATRLLRDAGIIPRVLCRVFEHVKSVRCSADISVTVSLLQIYNETVQVPPLGRILQ